MGTRSYRRFRIIEGRPAKPQSYTFPLESSRALYAPRFTFLTPREWVGYASAVCSAHRATSRLSGCWLFTRRLKKKTTAQGVL